MSASSAASEDSSGPGATAVRSAWRRRQRRSATPSSQAAEPALAIDHAVYRSEGETGHRNRAIAHLLKGTGAIDGDPDRVVDRYLKSCSVEVDVRDLAVIAATLASGGRNPLTHQQAASDSTVRCVLSRISINRL